MLVESPVYSYSDFPMATKGICLKMWVHAFHLSEVGIPEKNGTAFSNQTVTIKRNYGSCHFLFFFEYRTYGVRQLVCQNGTLKFGQNILTGILGTTSRDGTPETDLSVF